MILLFDGILCCKVPAKIEDQSPDVFAQRCCASKALFLPARDLLTDHENKLQDLISCGLISAVHDVTAAAMWLWSFRPSWLWGVS